MTTTLVDGSLHFELADPNERFEIRFGMLPQCLSETCNGAMTGFIHGEFWLKKTLYRQWMECTCSKCARTDQELIEVYDEPSKHYALLNYITIHDTTLDTTYQLPGFGASIAGLIQGAQMDGFDPGILMQETINAMMKKQRRLHLEA